MDHQSQGGTEQSMSSIAKKDIPAVHEILADPAASFWLKESLRSALARDPVDALNDADVLVAVLDRHARSALEGLRSAS